MRIPQVPWPVVWAVLQLGWRPGRLLGLPNGPWRPLTFTPAQLSVPEGANATFTCSFSHASGKFVLNLYRMSPSNQTYKLAAYPEDRIQPDPKNCSQPDRDRHFRVTPLPNGRDFHMSVVAVRLNDSGIYLCGAISLAPNTQIKESPHAKLTVTEKVSELPTAHPSPSPSPAGQIQGLVVSVTSVLVGVLVLLLLAWVLATTCPRATQGHISGQHERAFDCAPCAMSPGANRWVLPSEFLVHLGILTLTLGPGTGGTSNADQPLKEASSAGPVFSVDYEELDFQAREKTPEPSVPCDPEPTEYATIVFPSTLGVLSPGRRVSADSPGGPRPPRTEDGHCSWPF
ncbi:programmed cell death protein 1 [Carlito syrichta]|uniref:Programmed cell death protein 1 n=1 Tax=Carlito syrichta TaxID=1868482 RepID=A0A1U7U7M9_CARSF|nr:programmed cell death protein 1 [Carlito syrichta]